MKKIIRALVLALCVALAVCAFAVVSSAEDATVYTVTNSSASGAAGTFEGELISAMNSGAPAIVKLESDGSFAGQLTIDSGAAVDITIDLNGHTLNMWSSGNYYRGFMFETHGTKFTICDTSENGGGTINTNMPVAMLKRPWSNAACGEVGNHTQVVFDSVTVNYSGAGVGYMNCPIEVEDLCVDLDVNNCVFNSPNAGFIHVETNMSQIRHAFDFYVHNTTINAGAYVVRFDQGDSRHMVNYHLVKDKVWTFENCTITTEGNDGTYPFMYPNWGNASAYWNYLPSHHMYVDNPGNSSGWGAGEVVPSEENLPVLYLENCTVSTKADGLVSSPAFNPSSIYINGGAYKINTDGEANGESFISRGEETQMFQKVTFGTYDDGDNLYYPSFNFDPTAVTSTVFGGLYNANCMKNGKTYTINRDPYLFSVAETAVGEDTMWVLEDRAFKVEGMFYNLSLANEMGINLAIPAAVWENVTVALEGATLTSKPATIGGEDYYLVSFIGINAVSTTEVYSFVITENATGFKQTVELSVLGYATEVLAGTYTDAEQELARAILKYALEAEKTLGENNTAAISALEAALVGTNAPANVTEFAGDVDTADLGATVLYGAAIDFSGAAPAFVITLDEGYTGADVVVTVTYKDLYNSTVTNVLTLNADKTSARIEGMKAYNLDNTLTITIEGVAGEFTYNLATYLNDYVALNADFANAIYNYVNAAQAYQDARLAQ